MLGELIAILAVITFAGSNVIFRKTEHEASPVFINLFRTGIGTITFILIALIISKLNLIFLVSWDLWGFLILSFIFGQVIGDTAYFNAQKTLGTTVALAISMTFPLFTFILSLIFLGQPFKINLIVSLLFIGVGITIIGKSKINSGNSHHINEGAIKVPAGHKLKNYLQGNMIKAIAFCFAASLGWAFGAVIIEYATSQIDLIVSTELSSILGNVIRFPFAFLILTSMVLREKYFKKGKEDSSYQKKKTLRTWILLIIASVIGTSLGAYLYTESVHMVGANFVSLIASASPLFALPLTYAINKEKVSKYSFIGVVLTIIGVVIIII